MKSNKNNLYEEVNTKKVKTAVLFPRKFFAILLLIVLLTAGGVAEARNPDISDWTRNLSESAGDMELGEEDFAQEIVVVGSTVHVMWITRNLDFSGYRLYYRRSTDNGNTWESKQLLFEDDDLVTDKAYKRMVVTGSTVHIAFSYYSGSWYGVLGYVRSTDNGASFEQVRDLFTASNAYHVYDVRVAASDGKLTIGFRNQCNWKVDNGYYLLNSDDDGDTFVQRTVYSTDSGSGWYVADLLRVNDRIYVAYTNSYYYYGLQYGRLYLAASTDAGETFTSTLISVPSLSGEHKASNIYDYHYVPKIAGVGDTVTVIWNGLDAEDVFSVFIRRSTDAGDTFGDAVNLSKGIIPDEKAIQGGHDTIVAKGNYVYSLFTSTAKNVYFRRSTDGGANFGELKELTSTDTPYLSENWWPVIATDPTDTSGAKVHVFWSCPAYVYSTDGGATFTKPELVSPYFSYSGTITSKATWPQMAVGEDGKIHLTGRSRYYSFNFGGYGDFDIFYRGLSPAPRGYGDNNALHLYSNTDAAIRDNMQVPACDDLNFTSQMTGEVWVRPYSGGTTTGSTSEIKPVFFKMEKNYLFSYSMQTWNYYGNRQARAQIQTADGSFSVHPEEKTEGLVPDGSWSHLAFTYDAAGGADNLKLYLNGQLIASSTATGNLATGDGLFFTGYYGIWDVTEIRLWSRVLSQDELAASMYTALKSGTTGLNAYYRFKNTTKDFSGRGNDGILMYKEQYIQQAFITELKNTANVMTTINMLLME